jgi:peptidase C25-like protein/flagellar hook capping protein FlgD/VCBS repeat protein/fibronectin type III domain protein
MHPWFRQEPKISSPHLPPVNRSRIAGNTRRLPVWLVVAGLCLTAALSGSDPEPARTVVRDIVLDPGALTRTDVNGWSRLTLSGGARGSFAEGLPDLPTYPVHLELPFGTRATTARVEVLDWQTLSGTYRISGVTSPKPGQDDLAPVPPTVTGGWFPAESVVSVRTGRMRGKTLGAVVVCPLSWNADSGTLRLATRFRVIVGVEDAPASPDDLTLERESPDGLRTFDDAFVHLVGSPARDRALLAPKTLPSGPFVPGFRPSVDGSPVDMVIVTPADQEAEYQRLATFHTQTGLMTVVRNVTWIEANYPHGADRAETIRNFIKDAVSKWGTAWILLGGDVGQIPIRHSYSIGFANEQMSTDLYYGDLDRNWNADGDSTFGEGDFYNKIVDNVDLYPDVWVGRLPSQNAAQAKILVDKTLAYLQNPPIGYQKDALVLAEVLFPDSWEPGQSIGFDGAVFAEGVIDSLPPTMRKVRMYENYTAWPGSLPEQKAAVLDSMDAGFHLVHIVSHGFINTISLGLNHYTMGNLDAASLSNGNEQFLLFTMDCTSSAIDYNSIDEQFLLNPGGGAFASVGATEVEYPSTAAVYEEKFYHFIFRAGVPELGAALALSRVPYVPYSTDDGPHRWTQMSLIYLGDPSIPFIGTVPKLLTVSHASGFTLGSPTFNVNVLQNGQPLANAKVTLFKDNDEYATGTTNTFGQAVVPFHPDLTGSFCIGVTAPGCIPHLDSAVVVTPASKAYLYAATQTILDGTTGSQNGNGDARLDAGETVELRFAVKNQGTVTATGVSGLLSVSDPYVTVLDGASAFANIAVGSTITATDPMLIRVNRSAPDRYEAHGTLTLNGTNGPFVEDVVLWVHAPSIEYKSQSVRDSVGTGNNNGIVEVNEDLAIVATLRNAGAGGLRSASLRLRSQDPAVVLQDTVITIGNVAAGTSVTQHADTFRLKFTNLSSPHPVTLAVLDAYGQVYSRKIDVFAPGTPGGLIARASPSSITLLWSPVSSPDLWGYAVYRAPTTNGPFTRVNPWTVFRTSLYEDNGLPPFTRYAYKIAAVDSSGNEGPRSVAISVTTGLPLHAGWPVDTGAPTPAGIALADVNGDGHLEVLAGGLEILALTADGNDVHDGDQNAQTLGPLTNTGASFWGTPAAGDLKGDGSVAIAAIGWNDLKLHVVDIQGNELPGWPKTIDIPSINQAANPVGSVCLGDLDADGKPEVFATVGKIVFGWHPNGVEIRDGDGDPLTNGVFALTGSMFSYGTPSVANVDADPYRELIAGMRDGKLYVFRHDGTNYPGFPFNAGGDITTGPAVGDIDRDGRMEIVFGSSDGFVHALRTDLTEAAGFPKAMPLNEDWDSSPALGDVTGDGAPDIAIGSSDGFLHLINGMNGTEPAGFPVNLASGPNPVATRSSPVLADVDGNGSVDILIGDRNGLLHAYNPQGLPLAGFPIQTGNRIEFGPAVGDMDGDGLTEIAVESLDQNIYVWDTPWAFTLARAPWPMFKGNPRHTGALGDPAFSAAATGVPDGGNVPLFIHAAPNPFRGAATLQYRVPAQSPVRLIVYDLSGRAVRRLVMTDQSAGEYSVHWNGTDDASRRVGAGMYVYRLSVGGRAASGKLVLLP